MKCFKLITIKLTFWLHGSSAEEVEDRLKCVQVLGERSVAELGFRFWTKSLLFSSTSQTQLAPKPQLQAAFLSVSSCAPWCNQLCTHCCNQSPIVITAVLAIISQIIALAISLAARFIAIAIAVDQRGSRSRESKPHQIICLLEGLGCTRSESFGVHQ